MNAFDQLLFPCRRSDFAESCWPDEATLLHPEPTLLEALHQDACVLCPEKLVAEGHDTFRILAVRNEAVRQGNGSEAISVWRSEPLATLVAGSTQLTLESVWSYSTALMNTIGVPFRWLWPNIYYSRPGSGFTRHWDNHENFILGLKGTKRFVVAPNGCIAHPTENADNVKPHIRGFEEAIEAERMAASLPGMREIDVGPGDCIFIPRGWWHEAFALDDDSVTLTLAVWTCTWADLLAAGGINVPPSAVDLTLRSPLPLDVHTVPEDLGLPREISETLPMLRAQAELLAIANVTNDWRVGLKKRSFRRSA